MRFLRNVFLGLVIGIASITPGLSGGAIAAAMGLYEPIIRSLSQILNNFKKNFYFLLPFVIGGGIGVLVFSNSIEWLMQQAPNQVKILFLGLVAGSIPALIREANNQGFRLRYILASLIGLAIVYWGANFKFEPLADQTAYGPMHFILFGLIYAVGSIVPGISSSFIFMHLGVYDDMLNAISTLNFTKLLPAAIGLALGAIILIRCVEFLFSRYHTVAYYAVLGFLLGSALLILPSPRTGLLLLWDIAIFALGVSLSVVLLKLSASAKVLV